MQRDLKERSKKFALRIIKLYSALPRRGDAQVLANTEVGNFGRSTLSRGLPRKV
jgi:hypothetical protein